MDQEVKDSGFEVKPIRKRRTMEQREADAQKELATLAELKKVNVRAKIQHAIDTLETIPESYKAAPVYAQHIASLKGWISGIK